MGMRVAVWLSRLAVVLTLCGATTAALAQPGPPMAATPVSGVFEPDYRLGPGDKLRVIVYGEEDLTGEFVVGGSGAVALPLVGEVNVKDRTVAEFQTDVATRLREGYLTDPKVSVEVLTYRPFFILGEVNKPGTYPYTSGLTVITAVATAQGFTYRANTKKVFLKRANESREREMPLGAALLVQPGDTIRIGERFF